MRVITDFESPTFGCDIPKQCHDTSQDVIIKQTEFLRRARIGSHPCNVKNAGRDSNEAVKHTLV